MTPDSETARLLVVFGATGDLARRKIFPALYNLARDGRLPERFAVVGYARSEEDDHGFRARARQAVAEFSRRRVDEGLWERLARSMFYVSGGFGEPEGFARLTGSRLRGVRCLPAGRPVPDRPWRGDGCLRAARTGGSRPPGVPGRRPAIEAECLVPGRAAAQRSRRRSITVMAPAAARPAPAAQAAMGSRRGP